MHSVLTAKIEDRRYNEEEDNKERKTCKSLMGTIFRRSKRHSNNICTPKSITLL